MVENIYLQREKPLEEVQHCAIGIVGDEHSTHLGFFYRDPVRKRLYLLHLVVQCLCDEIASDCPNYLWGVTELPEERRADLAVKAMLVRDENQKNRLPYGYSMPEGFFDEKTGKMLLDSKNVGLTCATLVLSLFHMIGIELIDYNSWSARPKDQEVQDWYIRFMTKQGFDPIYVEAVKGQANGFRYRPEEVMAAAITAPEVNTMEKLRPLGEKVHAKILSA